MIKLFSLSVCFLLSSLAYSDSGLPYPSECIKQANNQVLDFNSLDRPIYFDSNGKVTVPNPDKIVKRNTKDGVETITYRTTQIKGGYVVNNKPEYETVEKTIVITRNSQGNLVGITKELDLEQQSKINKGLKKNGWMTLPIVKSIDNDFVYKNGNCFLNQEIGLELKDEKAKAEKKVYYDKKFCDQLALTVKRMGVQNAGLCVGLINQAQFAYDSRNKELAKEGKALKDYSYIGTKKEMSSSGAFNIGVAIQSCSIPDIWWGPGGGTGLPSSFGIGGMVMDSKDAKPVKDEVQPSAR